MKSHLLLFTFICCVLTGCGSKSNDVVITGHIAGLEDGTVITLNIPDGQTIATIASDSVKNEVFSFTYTDTIAEPQRLMVMARGEGFPPTWLDVWVEPGAKVKITGNDKLLRTWDVKSNVKEQAEENKFKALTKEYEKQTQAIMRDAYALFDEMNAHPEKADELYAQVQILYAQNDSLSLLQQEAEVKQLEASTYTGTCWVSKLAGQSRGFRYNDSYSYGDILKTLAAKMSDEQKNSELGKTIMANLFPPTVVKEGDEMADTDLYDTDGNLHHLADYKGKYILLDFRSSGCGPCIAAIPEMKQIAEQYKDKLTIVSISSDSKDLWKQTSEEKDITWTNLNDFKASEGIFMNYDVRGIPHYVLITPEGILRTTWTGYGEGTLSYKMKEFIK